MTIPDVVRHEPALRHICDCPACYPSNYRVVECRHCRNDWPCPDYREVHAPAQVAQQELWAQRVREL